MMSRCKYFGQGRDPRDARIMKQASMDLCGFDRQYGRRGLPITEWNPDTTFVVTGTGVLDFPMVHWRSVSDRAKELIEASGMTGVEFHPLRFVHEHGLEIPKYWHMNVLRVDGAIDLESSVYVPWPGTEVRGTPMGSWKRLVLRREAIAGRDLFRPAELEATYIVSERYRDLALEHKFTGVRFREAECI